MAKVAKEVEVSIPSIEGLSKIDAIVELRLSGMDKEAASKYYSENKPEPIPSFKARFYAILELGPVDDETFAAIIAKESSNVQAHKSAHDAVRKLVNKIHG